MHRLLLIALIAGTLAAPVAAASAIPDPTWIDGLYDGGDGDELVALVWELTPGAAPSMPDAPRLQWSPLVTFVGTRPPIVRLSRPFESRAPPLARSSSFAS